MLVRFPIERAAGRHGEASAGWGGRKRSGLNSSRGTPVTRSISTTRSAGILSHCAMAARVMPSDLASSATVPFAATAF